MIIYGICDAATNTNRLISSFSSSERLLLLKGTMKRKTQSNQIGLSGLLGIQCYGASVIAWSLYIVTFCKQIHSIGLLFVIIIIGCRLCLSLMPPFMAVNQIVRLFN
jgi:hypothetical protein